MLTTGPTSVQHGMPDRWDLGDDGLDVRCHEPRDRSVRRVVRHHPSIMPSSGWSPGGPRCDARNAWLPTDDDVVDAGPMREGSLPLST